MNLKKILLKLLFKRLITLKQSQNILYNKILKSA